MHRLSAIFASVALAAAAAALAIQDSTWAEFKSSEGKFAVQMPGKPQFQKQPVDTAVGKVQMNLYIAPDGASVVYFVAFSDYPADAVSNSDASGVLTGCRDGMIQNQNGKILSDKAIKLGSVPGREFTWDGANGFSGSARIFLKQNRLYQVMVLRTKSTAASQSFDKFFSSFKIL